MAKIRYQDLSVLVADDFSSFRSTVNSMLLNLGVYDIDMASNGEEVIEKCQLKAYDVVLCDYDLGAGRNGQHVLEELRYRDFLASTGVFIMISAEASRNIVMSAYDCEPDDYLMKPITGLMLQQRMQRLLTQKDVLRPVYTALREGRKENAVDMLTELSLADDRNSGVAQKMLGELFIELGEYQKAEKLYVRALEIRPLDWARLGLAKVRHFKNDLETAEDWLEKIVEENPLYLPAYDVLADNWQKKGDLDEVQSTVERAVDVSPMSILRQKRLAKVADENGDMVTALDALRKTIKLGKLSCYGGPEDSFNLARVVSKAVEKKMGLPSGVSQEAAEQLAQVEGEFELGCEEKAQMQLIEGRIHVNQGNNYEGQRCLNNAQDELHDVDPSIDTEVDMLELLSVLDAQDDLEQMLQKLQVKYDKDQSALEKLDKFLTEPASDSSRELVSKINREGIDLYSDGEFDRAIECFEKARRLFPKHVGIQLNILQSVLGKLKEYPEDDDLQLESHEILEMVESVVDKHHSQFGRYMRLKKRYDEITK